MLAIYKREMRSYFSSPIGYIFMAVFIALSGLIFSWITLLQNNAETGQYYQMLIYIFVMVIPLLTMKLMSEERKTKTEQILLTAPVSISGIVLAKFFAAFTLFALTFIISEIVHITTLVSVLIPENLALQMSAQTGSGEKTMYLITAVSDAMAKIGIAAVIGNILGVLLIGAAFIAIGLFLSSLTESQIVAAISTIASILGLMLIFFVANGVPNQFIAQFIRWFAILSRFQPFTIGILDLASIVYYISMAIIFLFLSIRVYEKRRWA